MPELVARFDIKPTIAPTGKEVPVLPFGALEPGLGCSTYWSLVEVVVERHCCPAGVAHPTARVSLCEGAFHAPGRSVTPAACLHTFEHLGLCTQTLARATQTFSVSWPCPFAAKFLRFTGPPALFCNLRGDSRRGEGRASCNLFTWGSWRARQACL